MNWSEDSLTWQDRRNQARTVRRTAIGSVTVLRKGSRLRSAGWGALAGFGIGFAIGAPSTGYFTDRNDPSVNERLAIGSGMGLFSAGIGGGIGALAGGTRHVVIYRNR